MKKDSEFKYVKNLIMRLLALNKFFIYMYF